MKIKLLILLIAPLLLMNCKEDEVNAHVGTWIGTTMVATGCTLDEDNFSDELACDENSCYRLTVNEDGTFSYQEGLRTNSGTWSNSKNVLSLCTLDDGEEECIEYNTNIFTKLSLSLLDEETGCTVATTFIKDVPSEIE